MEHKADEEYLYEKYKYLEHSYRVNCYEKHNQNFEKCKQESEMMDQNARNLVEQFAQQLNEKEQQIKCIKGGIKERKDMLRELEKQKQTVVEKLSASKAKHSRLSNFSEGTNIRKAKNNLQKDVTRLMTEKLDLQKVEKKLRDQIRQMNCTSKQLMVEMDHEELEVSKLHERVSMYTSNSFIDHQDKFSELNKSIQPIRKQRNRNKNKSCASLKFISSEIDSASEVSFIESVPNCDFVDITSGDKKWEESASKNCEVAQSRSPFNKAEKDQINSLGGSTADNMTMATKRSTTSEFDTRSWNEK